MALKLSIPLANLKMLPLHISIPSSVYANALVSNGKHLGDRLRANNALLPRGWSLADGVDKVHTTLYKVQTSADGVALTCSVVIQSNLTWSLTVGSTITQTQIPTAPSTFTCLQQVVDVLTIVDSSKLCIGSPDEQYSCLLHNQGNQSGK